MKKERLDVLLTQRGLAPSREKAKALIMAGQVYVAGQKEDKPGSTFAPEAEIEVRGHTLPYVSRGGLKLEKAVREFNLTLAGLTCMDIGASTGGFTDCMLQNGAVKVYSIDVGHGQLDWKLREDERVVCMERCNARYLTKADIPDPVGFISVDVSFISLRKILGPASEILENGGKIAALIKPQFEAGRDKVGKKGVVRDRAVHEQVIGEVCAFAQDELGLRVMGLTFSPIRGPEGNIEYLVCLGKGAAETESAVRIPSAARVTEEAHRALGRENGAGTTAPDAESKAASAEPGAAVGPDEAEGGAAL